MILQHRYGDKNQKGENDMNSKKIVISCGPIPARLDSVKFITNRFKGGLAFKTAQYFIDRGHDIDRSFDVTVIMWKHTKLPYIEGYGTGYWSQDNVHVVTVNDVYEYYDWFKANAANYDAFIMAAAVANLSPVSPFEGKFPSHNYKVGEEFDIKFCIAPRAIDIIKQVNPRACLIGYKLFDGTENELIRAAELTLKESKANVIFANRPDTAKIRKLALTQDGAVIPMNFEEHLAFIRRAIEAEYYQTKVVPMTEEERNDPDIKTAVAIVKLYEQTFPKYGTVAVPVRQHSKMFVTTSRGHKGEPVLVRDIDHDNRTILASAKATLNAPTLETVLIYTTLFGENGRPCNKIVVHRHEDDPLYDTSHEPQEKTRYAMNYLFPGTFQEVATIRNLILLAGMPTRIVLPHHGDLTLHRVLPVDWNWYYEFFPKRYFDKDNEGAKKIASAVAEAKKNGEVTLELGSNTTTDCQYAYDPFVAKIEGGERLTLEEVLRRQFHLTVCRNAVNYIPAETLKDVLSKTERFMANTFLVSPDEKISDCEAAIKEENANSGPVIRHALRLPTDAVMVHKFFAYDRAFYEELGLTVTPYGKNSALVTKGF